MPFPLFSAYSVSTLTRDLLVQRWRRSSTVTYPGRNILLGAVRRQITLLSQQQKLTYDSLVSIIVSVRSDLYIRCLRLPEQGDNQERNPMGTRWCLSHVGREGQS